jgi:hypothetical protein
MKRLVPFFCVAVFVGVLLGGPTNPPEVSEKKVLPAKLQYVRDIQPILSANCFTCHGPDEKTRKAGLRLDLAEEATKELRSGSRAIVPGDLKKSQLVVRIFASGRQRMPPANSHKTLKDAEKKLLARWIKEGGVYERHWAFVAPKRPALPTTKNKTWARNAVDHFVLARLEADGLQPAPEADRYTLARRVAIDLTGLPPTLEAVDQFVNDKSPNAYEKYVDRVMQSPAYGERWAQVWLDLARYADSNGYATDNPRTIWKYRDWVIEALNKNLPFDQFTIEQIAGDLLPQPTQEQILATAFHRNTLTNDEGGTSDEEFRNVAVVDRVNTTMQVWMGMTMGCAQCHDHKYDPISQEEYFRTFAIFNQTEDADRSDNAPLLTIISLKEKAKKLKLETEIAGLDRKLNGQSPELDAAQQRWEGETKVDKLPPKIKAILAVERSKRDAKQKTELTKYFRSIAPETKATRDQLASLRKQLASVQMVTTPIMKELPNGKKRTTKIHIRGNFLNLGKEVKPGIPAAFPPLPKDQPANRLGLARWLVDPANPLTARVTVNRFWEQLFGVGLVETPEDWGIRGKLPNHPQLLDWLATELIELKWDVKKFLRLLVTSATYRQSSRVTDGLLQRDPDNRLFARGPRFRSSAEVIRDQALFVSGLLSPKRYGPPVRPPQPKLGLTAAFGGGTDWTPSAGEDRYRRALYTQWRRTTPYPSMITFDAPSRNVCTVTRPRTNTPLQALVTLNDPVYVEAAQALARRIVKEGGANVAARAQYAFRLCLARPPREAELKRLVELFQKAHKEYAADPREAQQMATDPLGPLSAGMNAPELAAWTVVSNVLLNLDEMFAKR